MEGNTSINSAINSHLDAYAYGSEKYFDAFAEDAVVYNLYNEYVIDDDDTFKGREAYRKHFEPHLSTKRKVNLLQQDVQVKGDTTIVSSVFEVTQSDIQFVVRQFAVWAEAKGEWKIMHMNNTCVGNAVPLGELPRTAKGISVLNERIATVAAVLGVAQ
jgi:ketosteroid isomerase-like protein